MCVDIGEGLDGLGGASVLVRGDGAGKILLILEDLSLDLVVGQVGQDVGGGVDAGRGVGLLDGDAATEGSGLGVVTAAYGAYVSCGGYVFEMLVQDKGKQKRRDTYSQCR